MIERDISIQFPEKMKNFLNEIPRTTNIIKVFNYINGVFIDPATDRDLYCQKMSIQQAADLFVTNYLPVSDHSEHDIMRRVWGS
jgi:hypothetical protein